MCPTRKLSTHDTEVSVLLVFAAGLPEQCVASRVAPVTLHLARRGLSVNLENNDGPQDRADGRVQNFVGVVREQALEASGGVGDGNHVQRRRRDETAEGRAEARMKGTVQDKTVLKETERGHVKGGSSQVRSALVRTHGRVGASVRAFIGATAGCDATPPSWPNGSSRNREIRGRISAHSALSSSIRSASLETERCRSILQVPSRAHTS